MGVAVAVIEEGADGGIKGSCLIEDAAALVQEIGGPDLRSGGLGMDHIAFCVQNVAAGFLFVEGGMEDVLVGAVLVEEADTIGIGGFIDGLVVFVQEGDGGEHDAADFDFHKAGGVGAEHDPAAVAVVEEADGIGAADAGGGIFGGIVQAVDLTALGRDGIVEIGFGFLGGLGDGKGEGVAVLHREEVAQVGGVVGMVDDLAVHAVEDQGLDGGVGVGALSPEVQVNDKFIGGGIVGGADHFFAEHIMARTVGVEDIVAVDAVAVGVDVVDEDGGLTGGDGSDDGGEGIGAVGGGGEMADVCGVADFIEKVAVDVLGGQAGQGHSGVDGGEIMEKADGGIACVIVIGIGYGGAAVGGV